ncbi:tRNA pseudouridine(55) synthase TruB [Lactococcus sp.]|uniref:tRNA pseudouridine(55) synthase TruB n=1 Tax=Lactococcus sp. TaxID=44273 RepID=UPI0035B1F4CF
MNENWNGILNVYKEAGWTSFDVVAKLRGILKTKKIGHGGTLDPEVTGVLPVAVGKATRLLEYMEQAGKVYEGEVTLGFSTDTEDAQGKVISRTPLLETVSADRIDAAIASFVGEIEQIPPMYSAVKINGKKLYEYAREGKVIDRPARLITIKSFERTSPVSYDANEQTARFRFKVACSKGTYVRTLSVDLALKLGLAGHMSQLQRTAANGLLIDQAISLETIEKMRDENRLSEFLYPIEYAVSDLTKINLSQAQAEAAKVGKKFDQADFVALSALTTDKFAAMYDNQLVAIYMKHPEKEGVWKPSKVLG